MKKISNKGFVLAETIIVAVFMVTIFSALYSNYFPIMANYEKRAYYDDLDSKYIAFWLKYMIQDPKYSLDCQPYNSGTATDPVYKTFASGSGTCNKNYFFFSCNKIDASETTKRKACRRLVKEAGLVDNLYCKASNGAGCNTLRQYNEPLFVHTGDLQLGYVAIITPYNLTEFKKNLNDPNNDLYTNISDGMIDYINSLPDYVHKSNNNANYRIILELYDNRETERNAIYKYATIEVTR